MGVLYGDVFCYLVDFRLKDYCTNMRFVTTKALGTVVLACVSSEVKLIRSRGWGRWRSDSFMSI